MPLDLVANLLPNVPVAAVLAAAGAAAGAPLARLAARRTVKQPLTLAVTDETTTLAAALADPTRYPLIAALRASDFAVGTHHRIWTALTAAVGPDAAPSDTATEDECRAIVATLTERTDTIRATMRATLAADPTHAAADAARVDELTTAGAALTDDEMLAAGGRVLDAGRDRNDLAGTGLVTPSGTPDSADPAKPPLRREYLAPSKLRQVATSAALAGTGLLTPAFVAGTGLHGLAAGLAGLAVLILLALSAVIALVDLDTFYIDWGTFRVGAPAAWVVALAALATGGQIRHALTGALIVAGTALVFEGGNWLYKLVRKIHGQGFGDTIIIIATAGVPAALTGSFIVGYYSVMAGMLAGIVGWIVGAARGRLTRTTPYAFGPYLAAGWVLGWAAVLLTH